MSMKINLTEVPEEGRSYHWNRETGELNAVLNDLIGNTSHEADFFIKPLNSKDFELTGTVRTKLPEQCGRCGIDFAFPINEKYHEILIPKQNQPRNSKYSKVNHVSDLPQGGPETSEYEGNLFDMGEFLHEVVALAAPFNPAGPEDENGDCSICKIPVKGRSFSYDEKMPEEKPQNPFNVLKNIKLN
ncbi:YceD family protein [Bdellovibrio sp. HCB2-146]|uniref:YceD family protein n=1 Tax=Bdellovibrio sp. HCB2-146 TaxID=3394362 RepID=UPI0039BC7567